MMDLFGGAIDVSNFRSNISHNYLPPKSSITYNGLINEYYFPTSKKETENPLTITAKSSISKDPKNQKEKEYFTSILVTSKYDGDNIKKLGRPKLNLVIVLDISGSMSSSFVDSSYRNTKSNETEKSLNKLEIAKRALKGLTEQLKETDNFGMIVFDNETDLVQEFSNWKSINKDKMYQAIDKLQPRGGTDMSLGFKMGVEMLEIYLKKTKENQDDRQNRIIFLTDAHPNTGEYSSTGLLGLTKKYSEKKIYLTLVGIGVDFNTDLCNIITKTKGANYLSVNSASEFRRKVKEDFDFIVTPIAFDLQIKVEGAKILNVYGSPDHEDTLIKSDDNLIDISTVMPGNRNEKNETEGGAVILKLDKSVADGIPFKITTSYKDTKGNSFSDQQTVNFIDIIKNDQDKDSFEDLMARKSILLVHYVSFVHHILDKGNVDQESKKQIKEFMEYFSQEMKEIGDESLDRELGIFERLLEFDEN